MGRAGRALALVLLLGLTAGCPGEDAEPDDEVRNGLTEFQLEHGIGPFTEEIRLGPPDEERIQVGEREFQFKCEACHRLDDRLVGPPLRDVLDRRSPTFVANMIMNPEQMAREHPVVQELLLEYPVIMPYQDVSEEEALAIVEYLRSVQP